MTARRDREGAVRPPELTGVLDLEARVAEPLLRLSVVGSDDRRVPEERRGVALGEQQVDLGSLALEPTHRIAQSLRRIDLIESEQAPELDGSVGFIGRHLEGHVLEHARSESRAANRKGLEEAELAAVDGGPPDRESNAEPRCQQRDAH